MSYILNALKQSESQRSLGEIPHIDTAQEQPSPYRPTRRRALHRGWAVLGGLVPLLAIGWLLVSRPPPAPVAESPTPPPAEVPLALPPPAASAPAPAPVDSQAPGLAQLQGMAGTQIQLDDQPPPVQAQPAAPVVLELPVAAGRVTPPVATLSREEPPPPPIPQRGDEQPGPDAQLAGVSHWKGLPSGIQRQVRELGINAHVYSADSSARFIRAKSRSLREGDRLSDELQLQQITRDGIIFSYQGAPYWMRLN